jgi:hypothetical protein
MYYSYVEIEYVATSFSPARTDLAVKLLKKGIIQHRLLEPLHDAHTRDFTPEERTNIVIGIDKEGKTYMLHVEKICRKIKLCQDPFSPEAFIWIQRVQI